MRLGTRLRAGRHSKLVQDRVSQTILICLPGVVDPVELDPTPAQISIRRLGRLWLADALLTEGVRSGQERREC